MPIGAQQRYDPLLDKIVSFDEMVREHSHLQITWIPTEAESYWCDLMFEELVPGSAANSFSYREPSGIHARTEAERLLEFFSPLRPMLEEHTRTPNRVFEELMLQWEVDPSCRPLRYAELCQLVAEGGITKALEVLHPCSLLELVRSGLDELCALYRFQETGAGDWQTLDQEAKAAFAPKLPGDWEVFARRARVTLGAGSAEILNNLTTMSKIVGMPPTRVSYPPNQCSYLIGYVVYRII